MKKTNKKKVNLSLIRKGTYSLVMIAVIVFGLWGFFRVFAATWTDNTLVPPNGNVDAPINVGSNPQGKMGGLTIGTNVPGAAKLNVITSSGGAAIIGASTNSATGKDAIAMGLNTNAIGYYSTAMGSFTTAGYDSSTAMGAFTTASGLTSTAMGGGTTASGSLSTAMGETTNAKGEASTSMGFYTTASGDFSTAMGQGITVSGKGSVGIGLDSNSYLYTLSQDQAMAIMGGKVGIGTTSPQTTLDVNGLLSAVNNNTFQGDAVQGKDLSDATKYGVGVDGESQNYLGVRGTSSGTSQDAAGVFAYNNQGNALISRSTGSGYAGVFYAEGLSSNGAYISVSNTDPSKYALRVRTGFPAQDKFIVNASGLVGIGTTTPSSGLQINPPTNIEGLRIISSNYSPFVITSTDGGTEFLRVDQNGTLTVNSKGVCLSDGTNCKLDGLANFTVRGDLNHNGVVDRDDIDNIIKIQSGAPYNPIADFNNDNSVDQSDLVMALRAYNAVWPYSYSTKNFSQGDTSEDWGMGMSGTCPAGNFAAGDWTGWMLPNGTQYSGGDVCTHYGGSCTSAYTFSSGTKSLLACGVTGPNLQGQNWWPHTAGNVDAIACCSKAASTCGNGIVEAGEACDDGNKSDAQGYCSFDCKRINQVTSSSWEGIGGTPAGIFDTAVNENQLCIEAFGAGSTPTSVDTGFSWDWYYAGYNTNPSIPGWCTDCQSGVACYNYGSGGCSRNSAGYHINALYCTVGSKGFLSGNQSIYIVH